MNFLFTEWKEKIPFVKPAPIDIEETKKQKKQKGGQKKKEKGGAAKCAGDISKGVEDIKVEN